MNVKVILEVYLPMIGGVLALALASTIYDIVTKGTNNKPKQPVESTTISGEKPLNVMSDRLPINEPENETLQRPGENKGYQK